MSQIDIDTNMMMLFGLRDKMVVMAPGQRINFSPNLSQENYSRLSKLLGLDFLAFEFSQEWEPWKLFGGKGTSLGFKSATCTQ